jgi:hypothetical protein
MRALQLLGLMFGANERHARKVAFSEFYNQALSDSMDVQDEYIAWRRAKVRACSLASQKMAHRTSPCAPSLPTYVLQTISKQAPFHLYSEDAKQGVETNPVLHPLEHFPVVLTCMAAIITITGIGWCRRVQRGSGV